MLAIETAAVFREAKVGPGVQVTGILAAGPITGSQLESLNCLNRGFPVPALVSKLRHCKVDCGADVVLDNLGQSQRD